MSNNVESPGQQSTHVAASAKPLDYYSILTEAIQKTEQNSAQLRALVYERARFHLKREVLFGHSSLGLADLVRQINELELAIARIEATAIDRQYVPIYRQLEESPENATVAPGGNAVQIMPPAPMAPIYAEINPIPNTDYFGSSHGWEAVVRHVRAATRFVSFVLVGFLFVGLVTMGSALWYFPRNTVNKPGGNTGTIAEIKLNDNVQQTASVSNGTGVASSNGSPRADNPARVSFPLPTSFGIYVLHENKLTELETLPIGVPDSRVALSAEIKKPSSLVISDPKPSFILFRRDLLNNAPQKLALRVVARMVRETKIIDGKARVVDSEEGWRIRNISRDLNVSPIPGQPEMVIAHVEENTQLSPGRYALVLNRVAYDFTVQGPVTSMDFCLEGFETANGSVFNQCRAP